MRGNIANGGVAARSARTCIAATLALQMLVCPRPAKANAPLSAELDAIAGSSHLEGSSFGLTVYSVSQRRFLYSAGSNRPLVPASNQKLLVTAAALIELGPDFTFATKLYADGPVRDGVLHGDLILRGGGDPNLSGRFHGGDVYHAVDSWVRAVRDAGIKAMTGWLVIDDSFFDTQFFHPSWPSNQKHRWYAAAVGALSLNDSCINLEVEPTSLGAPASFSFEPYTPFIIVRNECKTVSGRQTKRIIIDRTGREIFLGGRIGARSKGYNTSVAVHDPGLFTGAVFHYRLSEAGIRPAGVMRAERKLDYSKVSKLMEYHSQDLATTVKVANAHSQNFYANMLLKYLGAHRYGQGTFDNGVAAVQDILRGRGLLDNIDNTLFIDDGCGLSHENRVSTRDLVKVMESMYSSDYRNAYVESLAMPGNPEGTLKSRLNGERHSAKIFAKSGYVNRAKALSGYVLRNDGEVLIFSFIVNNYRARSAWQVNNLQDELMRSLSDCVMY